MLLLALLGIYLALCTAVYFGQRAMLFPAHLAPPVIAGWKPSVGFGEQALLEGRCGKLHVALWKTAGANGTLMMFHGNGESLASVESLVPAFHAQGYDLMSWDYPGYGRSADCAFSQDDLLQDAELAYRWLASRANGRGIVLFGRSIGAGLALYVASRHPGHPVLLVSPYDSLAAVARDQMPALIPVALLMRYPLRAERWIVDVQAPIHAVHGLGDTLIRPARAARLQQQARGNMTLEWVENAGHNASVLFEKSYRLLAALPLPAPPETHP